MTSDPTPSSPLPRPPSARPAPARFVSARRALVVSVLVVLAAGLAAGGWWWWTQRSESPAPAEAAKSDKGSKWGKKGFDPAGRATPVSVAPVGTTDVKVYLNALGTITPLRTVTVRPRVEGQLLRVLFEEGQMVAEGDLLAEIDPRPFQVQLMQAEGQMAKDQALLANARVDLERYRTLFAQDSIARQQLDTQSSLVRQYEGAIQLDQAQIDNAKLQLVYTRVTAPISGRIGLRQIDPGNVVRSGDANGIVVITQLTPITAVFPIPQDSLARVMQRLRARERIPVEAWDREQRARLAAGVLLTADNQIDPQTGTVKLKAQFPNADGGLFPNQFVNVRMQIDVLKAATVVPVAAVQRGSLGTIAFVARDDNTVSLRKVETGPTEGQTIVILAGLTPGERVITEGTDRLRDGARIEIPAEGRGGGRGPRGEGKAGPPAGAGAGAAGEGVPKGPPPGPDGTQKARPTPTEAPATPTGPGEAAGGRAQGPIDPARAERWRNMSEAEKSEMRERRRREQAPAQ